MRNFQLAKATFWPNINSLKVMNQLQIDIRWQKLIVVELLQLCLFN